MKEAAIIGLDIGGTYCRGALVTKVGQVLEWRRFNSDPAAGLAVFLPRLAHLCRELQAVAASRNMATLGIGCGTAGIVEPEGKVLISPNLSMLDRFDLKAYLEQQFSLPVRVVNDADAIAWGEACHGSGLNLESFLTMTLGTGVGGGLILQRRLWQGSCGGAGEIGHLAVESRGRPCRCGAHGCLEQYASGTGILLNYREITGSVQEGPADSVAIARLARQGDAAAKEAFRCAGRYLGQALAGVVNLLNLDGVVFAGGVSDCFDLLRPALLKELQERAFEVNYRSLQLLVASCGEEAGILGSAQLLRSFLPDGCKSAARP